MVPRLLVLFGLSILTVSFQTAHGQGTAQAINGPGSNTATPSRSYRQTAPPSSAGSGAQNILGNTQQTNDAFGDAANALGTAINSALNDNNGAGTQQTQQDSY